MSIRIVRALPSGDVDGIPLDWFHVGAVYEVGNSLGALFLAEGWAEPVSLDAPRPYTPFAPGDPFDVRIVGSDGPPNLVKERHPPYLDLAADFRWRRRSRS